jgi:hypothetical protein
MEEHAVGPRNGEIMFRVCFTTMDVRLDPSIINLLLEHPRPGQATSFDRFMHATLVQNLDEFTLAQGRSVKYHIRTYFFS